MLAVTDDTVLALGWFFVPMVLVGSLLLLAVALIINNIQRQYPLYWWTPHQVERIHAASTDDLETLAGQSDRTFSGSFGVSGVAAAMPSTLLGSGAMVIPTDFVLHEDERVVLNAIAARLSLTQPGGSSSYQSQQHSNYYPKIAGSPLEKAPNE